MTSLISDIQAHINTVSCALLQGCTASLKSPLSPKTSEILTQFCEDGEAFVLYISCDDAPSPADLDRDTDERDSEREGSGLGVPILSLTLPSTDRSCIAFVKTKSGPLSSSRDPPGSLVPSSFQGSKFKFTNTTDILLTSIMNDIHLFCSPWRCQFHKICLGTMAANPDCTTNVLLTPFISSKSIFFVKYSIIFSELVCMPTKGAENAGSWHTDKFTEDYRVLAYYKKDGFASLDMVIDGVNRTLVVQRGFCRHCSQTYLVKLASPR